MMELKILKFSRILAVLLMLAGVLYALDEFLPPVSESTTVSDAKKLISGSGDVNSVVIFADQSEVVVDHEILPPAKGAKATVWYTPWFHGLKGAEFDVYLNEVSLPVTQVLGAPDKPRTASLILSAVPLLLCVVSLLVKRFEYAVGTIIFALIMSAVRFWIL